MTSRILRTAAASAALILAGGCWNGGNKSIDLGTVSIGQQMIDLKAALVQQAINQQEYDRLKQALMVIDETCGEEQD